MKKYVLPLLGMALYFAACEDDLTAAPGNDGAEVVASFKKLEKCEKAILGKLVYVSDSVKVYACTDDGWTAVTGTDGSNGKNGTNGKNGKDGADGKDGTDGKSCIMTAFKDGTGFDVICDGKSIGTVKNGTDGAKGKDGTNGKDGTSCSVAKAEKSNDVIVTCGKESVTIHNGVDGQPGTPGTNGANGKDGTSCSVAKAENSDDVVVTCGEKSVTIHNGVDGQLGAPGASGASCKIASDKDGVVQLQCGEGENATTTKLYKAMCGTLPYDPETSLCKDGLVYFKCGNETYNPQSEFCYENEKYVFCNGGAYDPSEQFCVDNKLYNLCGGIDYDPKAQECGEGNKIVTLLQICGEEYFDPEKSEFCAEFSDGTKQVYKYVTINLEQTVKDETYLYSETWMAENLRYEIAEGSFCENLKTSDGKVSFDCDKYGRLYTWAAAVGKTENECGYGKKCKFENPVQGACPNGWHLPTYNEWSILVLNFIKWDLIEKENLPTFTPGYVLKAGKPVWNGSNKYGFNALPAGSGSFENYNLENAQYNFDPSSKGSMFWSATENSGGAYGIVLTDGDNIGVLELEKTLLASVRCIKDKDEGE